MSGALSWAGAREILCVRLDSVGDVLMTTPALRALASANSSPRLTLLTSSAGMEVAELVPEVDDCIVYDAPWLKASPPSHRGADLAMIERLAAARFDAAVIFTVYSQSPLPSALMCHLSGIPLRLAHCRENPYGLLTDWVKEPEPDELTRHEVKRQLDLVAAVGATTSEESLSLDVPQSALAAATSMLAGEGVDLRGPWVVIHPGASAPSRRYPAAGFAAAARLLVDAGISVVLTGAAGERSIVDEVRARAGARTHSLAGRLRLAELAAVIALAPVLVCNNSGPAHIAAAVSTPVVDLYALTNPQHTPWRVQSRVLSHDVACRWCYKSVCPEGHHDCLRLVAPETVFAAARDLLEDTAAARLAAVTTS